ncbi:uncharacterized protein LOC107785733 [Nicotiana tabacum]|uniref:Uncharacterized protein LOC107785733 n=1 Tax=Nicotiana tabacum TaxID=4097 RepID=A0A1S3ZDS7_TOBAC
MVEDLDPVQLDSNDSSKKSYIGHKLSEPDMPGIPKDVARHKLNVNPLYPPLRQIRRKFNATINEAVSDEQISFHTTAAPIPSIAASFSTFPSSLVAALLLLLELLICQAYAYILNNCDEVQEYIREHEVEVNNQRRGSRWSNAKNHSQNFSQWFETRVLHEDVSDLIKQLSIGPNSIAKRYSGYLINGYRFHTRQRDARHKTQNSGVTLDVLMTSFASSKDKTPVDANLTYYGRIIDIVELDYYGHFKVVLFKCDWYEVEEDIYGFTYVFFNKKCYQEEPLILAYQAYQCFYVQDPYD